jgi:hypothetical protein
VRPHPGPGGDRERDPAQGGAAGGPRTRLQPVLVGQQVLGRLRGRGLGDASPPRPRPLDRTRSA